MTIANVSRRDFIKTSGLATGGLIIGVTLPPMASASDAHVDNATFNPNAFVHLQDNGDLLIYCGRCEMGQGINTALPAAVADEMEADWQRVTVRQADGDEEKYGPQGTGGSRSINIMFEPMRKAGASAKLMLIAAAAKVWKVPPEECQAENHFVYHQPSGKKLSFGQLANIAATLEVPTKPTLKSVDDFKYVGKFIPNQNIHQIIKGELTYGVDTKLPGLKYASVVHCPVYGGKLKSLDKSEALAIKGVLDVIVIERLEMPFGSLGGVAVVADNSWTAQKAAKLLKIEWERGHMRPHMIAPPHQI